MTKKSLDLLVLSDTFRRAGAVRLEFDAYMVRKAREFACLATYWRREYGILLPENKRFLGKMTLVAKTIAFHGKDHGLTEIILPHEGVSEFAKILKEQVLSPIIKETGIRLKLQEDDYYVDNTNIDRKIRTCLDRGIIGVTGAILEDLKHAA